VIDLLDEREPLLGKTSVHVIAFMNARHQTDVQKYIFDPIRRPLNPPFPDAVGEISSDTAVSETFKRLEIMISEASPILISSTLQPILRPLFLLLVHVQNTFQAQLKDRLMALLKTYFTSSFSATADALDLVHHLLDQSEHDGWAFAAGSSGGVAIRKAQSVPALGFDEIVTRISTFVEILGESADELKSDVFVAVIREWLAPKQNDPLR
jgi:hypothetical protein